MNIFVEYASKAAKTFISSHISLQAFSFCIAYVCNTFQCICIYVSNVFYIFLFKKFPILRMHRVDFTGIISITIILAFILIIFFSIFLHLTRNHFRFDIGILSSEAKQMAFIYVPFSNIPNSGMHICTMHVCYKRFRMQTMKNLLSNFPEHVFNGSQI